MLFGDRNVTFVSIDDYCNSCKGLYIFSIEQKNLHVFLN